jgi:hypothetical protein
VSILHLGLLLVGLIIWMVAGRKQKPWSDLGKALRIGIMVGAKFLLVLFAGFLVLYYLSV